MITTPVLLICFNRPHLTRRVFERIREVRPRRLYVSADAPRPSHQGDEKLCQEVREIFENIDWPCEVRTRFLQENLGCKIGPASAIQWFFDQESEGIILEDDILPFTSFFTFCQELLAKYREEDQVFSIGGNGYVLHRLNIKTSYIFSKGVDYWGWAGWRRTWEKYDMEMSDWPSLRDSGFLKSLMPGLQEFESHHKLLFDRAFEGEIDSYDYQLVYAMWKSGGFCILPTCNLAQNIGFGADATHTAAKPEWLGEEALQECSFPLVHPDRIAAVKEVDEFLFRSLSGF